MRAYATSKDGTTKFGEPLEINVTTPENTFIVQTVESSATSDSALLSGKIITNESNPSTITERGFEYWSKEDKKVQVYDKLNNDLSSIEYTLTDLSPSTEYTFRAFARYKDTIRYGENMSFTTRPSGADYLIVTPE